MPSTVFDTDSHVTEPPDLWTSRMSSRWGSLVPEVRWDAEHRSQYWFMDDHRISTIGASVAYRGADGGIERREEVFPQMPRTFEEIHPSAFDAKERVAVMDSANIAVAALYPNLGVVTPEMYTVAKLADPDFQNAVARAYNDFVVDWAAECPGRFVPLAAVPFWNVEAAAAEVERCATMGHRGVIMTGFPQAHGEPLLSDPHWDPLWAAAQANGMPISFHIGGASMNDFYNEERLEIEGLLAMTARSTCCAHLGNGMAMADILMSGVLAKYPDLKFVMVESGMGWIPFALETLDLHFEKYRVWRERPEMTMKPSEYFHRQLFVNYWFEKLQPWHLEAVGEDNLLFETDYPHPTCLIGDEVGEAVTAGMSDVSPPVRDKILYGNAAKLYGFEAA